MEKYVIILLCKVGDFMSDFNSKEFGNKLRELRKSKGLSQENLANELNISRTTISRFEKGEMIPNAQIIKELCEILGIYSTELFEMDYKVKNKDDIKNPFKSDCLYMYFNAYNYRTGKFGKGKYKLEIREFPNYIQVNMIDLIDNKIYTSGYILFYNNACFIILENYKPNNARLEVAEIIINVCNGVEDLMMGSYLGTDRQYRPSIRKCYFSKKDVEFTDEMFEDLKLTEKEYHTLKEENALYLEIFNN